MENIILQKSWDKGFLKVEDDIIKNMINKNYSLDEISNITGLYLEEVYYKKWELFDSDNEMYEPLIVKLLREYNNKYSKGRKKSVLDITKILKEEGINDKDIDKIINS